MSKILTLMYPRGITMTTKLFLALPGLVLISWQAAAQQVIRLYEGKAPGSENWDWHEAESLKNAFDTKIVYNVSDPTITVYRPSKPAANSTAIVIAPGGAFHTLSIENEGSDVARWLNSIGVTAFVLKYRLVKSQTNDPVNEMMSLLSGGNYARLDSINAPVVPLAMADGMAAVRYVRNHAKDFNISSERIGFMGFSAGATLTMSVLYNAGDEERPNFAAAVYAYEKAIIGRTIPKIRTPIFIAAASDDHLGFASHSVNIYLKWLNAKQPAELHMFQKGGHGFGMKKNNITTDAWIEIFADWLKMNGN